MKTLLVLPESKESLKQQAFSYPSWVLSDRQVCDLEMLLNGGFAPLKGFLGKSDYESVLQNLRLRDGSLWPMPITLDVTRDFAKARKAGDRITLRDKEGFALAVLTISDVWEPDLKEEARLVYGTEDTTHPAVHYLFNVGYPVYVGGTVEGITLPHHYDYQKLRHTPEQLRKEFASRGWDRVVAFQTRNPMHRAHVEITRRAAEEVGAKLLIHPVVGMTKPGDADHYTRVRCCAHVLSKFPAQSASLSLLPLAMRMGGPREAVWHGLIRKNYGCTHFIVGRDHAGPGKDKTGKPFYGPYDAQELFRKHEEEMGIRMVPFQMMVYVPSVDGYMTVDEVPKGTETRDISGTELREHLDRGDPLPAWYTYAEVAEELRKNWPERKERGFTVFFTGLPSSGKSSLANGLLVKLHEDGRRPVTLLDGDIVRTHLSSELGFSREHRSINVQRIGYVASEITKNRGIAICAPIAPYEKDRRANRDLIARFGGYIEVHVSTPLAVCETRDPKGLYAKAREGILKEFTGISDPYEAPGSPEISIDCSVEAPEVLVERLFGEIRKLGYL